MCQAVERKCGTINYSIRELRAEAKSHKVHDRAGGVCAAARVGQKVTVEVTIHDLMVGLRPNRASCRHLRQTLRGRFLKICRQSIINGPNVGGTV